MYNKLIKDAINKRCKLQFIYERCKRVVDPHVFGVSTKGHVVVLCWQTGGSSSDPKNLPNWRMFETQKINQLKILEERFVPQAKDHNPSESDVKTVYAVVKR